MSTMKNLVISTLLIVVIFFSIGDILIAYALAFAVCVVSIWVEVYLC